MARKDAERLGNRHAPQGERPVLARECGRRWSDETALLGLERAEAGAGDRASVLVDDAPGDRRRGPHEDLDGFAAHFEARHRTQGRHVARRQDGEAKIAGRCRPEHEAPVGTRARPRAAAPCRVHDRAGDRLSGRGVDDTSLKNARRPEDEAQGLLFAARKDDPGDFANAAFPAVREYGDAARTESRQRETPLGIGFREAPRVARVGAENGVRDGNAVGPDDDPESGTAFLRASATSLRPPRTFVAFADT